MDSFERQNDIDVPPIGLPPSTMGSHQADGLTPLNGPHPSAPPAIAAYIGDACAVFGTGAILDQKRAVDTYVATRLPGRRIDRIFVDSGRLDGPPAPGVAVEALLAHGRAGSFGILVVHCIGRLAPTLDLAFGVLAALWRIGIEVHEVSGGVVPRDEALIARFSGESRPTRIARPRVRGTAGRRASVAAHVAP